MSKWIAFILLLITTAATVIPCCGTDDCCGTETVTGTETEIDACSPFFACGACPHVVELSAAVQVPVPEFETELHFAGLENNQLPLFVSVFWQPPRSGNDFI
jgi:hypothetical protein